jgi:uncharacterized small protein (DUF1192 family)
MAGNGEKRIANTATDLIFYTNTDESDYPIYITAEREVWLKARPRAPIIATFFVKRVTEVGDVSHELHDVAVQAVTEVTKSEPEKISRLEITYEVYRGDVEEALGEAKAYAVLVLSRATPFRRDRGRAWAIGFDWKKRAAAKYPGIANFLYLKDLGRYFFDVRLCIKLPVITDQLERLFSAAVSQTAVSETGELEAQIDLLKREIEEKRAELKALEERLDALLLKLQLERMKREVV